MSERIKKVNELIKQELGQVILETVDFKPGTLVTIVDVDTAPNIRSSKVWLSVMPEKNKEAILNRLNNYINDIQSSLNRRLVMHYVPRIIFRTDNSPEFVKDIDKILDNIKSASFGA